MSDVRDLLQVYQERKSLIESEKANLSNREEGLTAQKELGQRTSPNPELECFTDLGQLAYSVICSR